MNAKAIVENRSEVLGLVEIAVKARLNNLKQAMSVYEEGDEELLGLKGAFNAYNAVLQDLDILSGKY